jgi:hypothetical protein
VKKQRKPLMHPNLLLNSYGTSKKIISTARTTTGSRP